MKKQYNISSILLIQLSIGLYFSITGLLGIIGYNSGINQVARDINKFFGNNTYIPLIISLCFLLAGLVLISGIIFNIKIRVAHFIILILWIVYIVINYFTDNFLKPEVIEWTKDLSLQLIILSGLWGAFQKRWVINLL